MIRISVKFDTKVNFKWMYYRPRIIVSFKRGSREVYLEPDPEKTAYLVNRYGCNLAAQPFGYTVDVPENVAVALLYLSKTESASIEELERIAETGTTRIHEYASELGLDENLSLDELFSEITRGIFELSLKHFPNVILTLYLTPRRWVRINFRAEDVDTSFLRDLLNGGASKETVEMLVGISLLGLKTQTKYMSRLSHGRLTKEQLANALFRSALFTRDRIAWKSIVDWLRRNGYEKYAGQIIVKKTLM